MGESIVLDLHLIMGILFLNLQIYVDASIFTANKIESHPKLFVKKWDRGMLNVAKEMEFETAENLNEF